MLDGMMRVGPLPEKLSEEWAKAMLGWVWTIFSGLFGKFKIYLGIAAAIVVSLVVLLAKVYSAGRTSAKSEYRKKQLENERYARDVIRRQKEAGGRRVDPGSVDELLDSGRF